MKIFTRKEKTNSEAYYFGEFGETPLAPLSVSVATFDSSFKGEPKHYHKENQEVYITISGKGILNVNGESVELRPDRMINVEPGDTHFVEKVNESPMQIVVILSPSNNDKVVVER